MGSLPAAADFGDPVKPHNATGESNCRKYVDRPHLMASMNGVDMHQKELDASKGT
jgi:hypothetical protein